MKAAPTALCAQCFRRRCSARDLPDNMSFLSRAVNICLQNGHCVLRSPVRNLNPSNYHLLQQNMFLNQKYLLVERQKTSSTVLSLAFLEDFPGVLSSSSALINSCSLSAISSCTEIGDSTVCGSGCSPDGDCVLLGEDILLVDILFVLSRLSHANSVYV